MSQRRAGIVDRWGKPLTEEAKPVTREQLIEAQNQLRAELNAVHRFMDALVRVVDQTWPGTSGRVLELLREENPNEIAAEGVQ